MSRDKDQLVSVIISIYNGCEIILETIYRFFQQPYNSFELITVAQADGEYRAVDQTTNNLASRCIKLWIIKNHKE